MKKLLMLTILIAGFGLSQASVAEKHPPGEFVVTVDGSGSGVQTIFMVADQVPMYVYQMPAETATCYFEFSNYLTCELSGEITTPIDRSDKSTIWMYGTSSGGLAYAYSTGLLNNNLFNRRWTQKDITRRMKTLPTDITQEVWLINCNIKTSPPVA